MTEISTAEYGDGRSTSSRDAFSAAAMGFIDECFFFVCSMNQIPSHLFLSREDDDGIGDIRKTRVSFGSSSLCYLILV